MTKIADLPNPLTGINDKLWEILEANSEFTTLVGEANRIKTDTEHRSFRGLDRDYPNVRIAPFGFGEASLLGTSTTGFVETLWSVEIRSGDRKVDERLFALQWLIYKIFVQHVRGQNTMLDLSYAVKMEWISTDSQIELIKAQSAHEGWTSVVQLSVTIKYEWRP